VKRLLLVALAALMLVPVALAGAPFRFTNRASFERNMAQVFMRLPGVKREHVRSIGCAKSGIGRFGCIVVADDPARGLVRWQLGFSCATDLVTPKCTYMLQPWTANP
jgi:hypothetical protein